MVCIKNIGSEPGEQNTFAESELKYSLNMDRNINWFVFGNKGSEPGEITLSQNQSLSVRSIWTSKCIDLFQKIKDLSRGDKTLSQNQSLNIRSIWTAEER